MSKADDQSDRSAQLQQQADLVCSALDAVPHGFAILSVEGRVLAANGTLKRWAGDEPAAASRAVPGPSGGGPALQGFCLSQRSELRSAVKRAAAGEAVCFETDRIELVPDVRGAFNVQVSPWTMAGSCLAVCLLIHDVTDGPEVHDRASELSFRQLFDAVPDALLVVRGSVVLYANRSSSALLGYDWQDELAGRPVFDLVRGADPDEGLPEANSGRAVRVALICRDGSTRPAILRQARLMIDESPTAIFALRPFAAAPTSLDDGATVVDSIRLDEALSAAEAVLNDVRAALSDGQPICARIDDLTSAVRRTRDLATLRRRAGEGNAIPRPDRVTVDAATDRGRATPTVLVCDDESRLAMLTAGLLDQYGYTAVTVATGSEALDQLERGTSDVLLLDMNLPDGSAEQVIAQMKQRGLTTPVILTSGYAEEDVDPMVLADDLVSSYLPKPYSVDRLVQAIRTAIGE